MNVFDVTGNPVERQQTRPPRKAVNVETYLERSEQLDCDCVGKIARDSSHGAQLVRGQIIEKGISGEIGLPASGKC